MIIRQHRKTKRNGGRRRLSELSAFPTTALPQPKNSFSQNPCQEHVYSLWSLSVQSLCSEVRSFCIHSAPSREVKLWDMVKEGCTHTFADHPQALIADLPLSFALTEHSNDIPIQTYFPKRERNIVRISFLIFQNSDQISIFWGKVQNYGFHSWHFSNLCFAVRKWCNSSEQLL